MAERKKKQAAVMEVLQRELIPLIREKKNVPAQISREMKIELLDMMSRGRNRNKSLDKISERQVSTGKRIPLDRVTSSPGIRIQVIIRKVIFHRKIMLLLRRMFLGRRKASHRMITTAGILTTNPKKRGNIAGGNIRTGRETGLLILSMTFRQRTALLRRVKGQSLKEAKS